jgi:hypothetical protein
LYLCNRKGRFTSLQGVSRIEIWNATSSRNPLPDLVVLIFLPLFENLGYKEGKWERSVFNEGPIDKLRSHHRNLDRDECLWR